MFKDRHLQVKYVKDPKNSTSEEDFVETTAVDYDKIGELLDKSALSFRETAEFLATRVIIGVGVYVAVDTLRQVIVKLTPTN
jgi:hypothetical protein